MDTQKLQGQAFSARLLSLLDEAYNAAEDPNGFDQLFVEADAFFFPDSAVVGLADDIAEAEKLSPQLEGHITRLQTLMDRAEVEIGSGARVSSATQVASLVISADGRRVVGNDAAEKVFGCTFPVSIDGLGMMPVALRRLRETLALLNAGDLEGSTLIALQHNNHDKPFLSKCTKLQSRGPDGTIQGGLSVITSHVEWHEDIMDYAADSFGLTPAETSLLACFLNGMSYSEAATALSKSRETLKTQGKSILRKTGVTQMSDVTHLMLSYAYFSEARPSAKSEGGLIRRPQSKSDTTVTTPLGRKIRIHRYGKHGGRPLLFFHGLYQGPYLTEAMDDDLARLGYDVIAPSRPGFDNTDPPADWDQFNQTTTDDVLAICDHFGLENVDFIVHQAGISFACRAARALGDRVGAAIMIGAGVPIKDYMLKTMNVEARVAGAAVKYAPKLLDMLLRLGITKWRRQGAYAYCNNLFKRGSPDRQTLDHPDLGPIMEKGIHHMISQGAQTIAHDGLSAMSDWEPEYRYLPTRQLWLHGAHDPVMNYVFVQEFLAAKGMDPPVIFEDRGGDVLIAAFDVVLDKIHKFLTV